MAKKEEVENNINIEKIANDSRGVSIACWTLKNHQCLSLSATLSRRTVQFVIYYKEITHIVSHGHELDIEIEWERNKTHTMLIINFYYVSNGDFFFENPSSLAYCFVIMLYNDLYWVMSNCNKPSYKRVNGEPCC